MAATPTERPAAPATGTVVVAGPVLLPWVWVAMVEVVQGTVVVPGATAEVVAGAEVAVSVLLSVLLSVEAGAEEEVAGASEEEEGLGLPWASQRALAAGRTLSVEVVSTSCWLPPKGGLYQ